MRLRYKMSTYSCDSAVLVRRRVVGPAGAAYDKPRRDGRAHCGGRSVHKHRHGVRCARIPSRRYQQPAFFLPRPVARRRPGRRRAKPRSRPKRRRTGAGAGPKPPRRIPGVHDGHGTVARPKAFRGFDFTFHDRGGRPAASSPLSGRCTTGHRRG